MFINLAHLVEAGTHESVTLTVSKGALKGEVRVAFFPVLSESKEKNLTDDEKNALTSNLILEGTPADLNESWDLLTEHANVLTDASAQIEEAKAKVKKATTKAPAKKAPAKKAAPRKTKAQLKEEARAKQEAEAPKEEFKDERSGKVDDEAKKELDKAADAVQATVPSDPEDDQEQMDDLLAGL